VSRVISLIDAHVHVYPGVDVPGLLTAAARNFGRAARDVGAGRWHGVLLLTEISGRDWFGSVAASSGETSIGSWSLTWSPDDPFGLRANGDGAAMTIVAGRQIVTAERIEVQAFGTRQPLADGLAARDTLSAVRSAGAVPALPWGVGKWLGGRGRLIDALLTEGANERLLAADIGGRPAFWTEPRLAGRPHLPVLRGTDPLPIRGEEYRVGEFGSWIDGDLEPTATALLSRLTEIKPAELRPYGRPETVGRFLRNQTLLRLRKRRPPAAEPERRS